MPKNVDIVYFVEHAARELDVACAVKYLLAERHSIQVEICSIVTGLEESLARWQPKVVAIPYGASVKATNLEKIITCWGDARYVNLSFEQVLGKTQKSFKAPKDQFARQHLFYTAWGNFFVDFLVENDVPVDNISVVGNPALALYTLPYRDYYGQARRELARRFDLDVRRRWVLVPENYGWAFFKDHMVRDRIRRGFNPQEAFQYRDFALASLQEAATWWRDGAKLDGIELIVRPRPAIPEENFRDTVREFAGEIPAHLHLIKYGTVREWILASDIVLSSYSTTLLDAAVAGKPVYMLTPYAMPDFLYAEWYDVTAKVSSFDQFATVVQADPMERNWIKLQDWARGQMMSEGDAIENLTSVLHKITAGESPIQPPIFISNELKKPSFDQLQRKLRHIGWNFWQFILSAVGSQSAEQAWDSHEKDSISAEDMKRRIQQWARVLN
jgi:surface carbohydrate biosynthesis protein